MTPHLKPRELAELLQVSLDTVYAWARRGVVPCLRPTPRVLRFDLAAVQAALAARSRAEGSETAPPVHAP